MRAAFLLHRRPYRDTSLLLECLIAGEGRMPLIARGAAKGRLKGILQPFQPLMLKWRGRGEVMTLTHAEAAEKPVDLKKKLLYCGFYLNELLMRLLPRGDACDNLMQTYWKTLLHLQHSDYPDWELRRFELLLLQEAGYGAALDVTCEGVPVSSNKIYSYDVVQGVTQDCSVADALIHGETLLALHHGEWRYARERYEAKLLMRRLIDHSMEYKPLKSRELFR